MLCFNLIALSLSWEWFKKVNEYDKNAKYPELIWDAMPKSGASQVHTHLQASLGINSYYGMMRRWLDASSEYYNSHGRDFLDDFILIHRALGLTYQLNNSFVIFNLVSRFSSF
jgi:galactose-1-phosphate uridylyltransferase